MKKNMSLWVEETISDPVKKAIPILSFPAVQLMGVTVKDLISDSRLQAEGMSRIAQRVESAAAMSLMDLSVEAECFGCAIRYSDDEVPTVQSCVVSSEEDAAALEVPSVGTGRTGICIETIEKAVQTIVDRPVFAGVVGPFSLTGRLMDVSETMIYCYEEPDMVHTVMAKATEFLIAYCKAYKAVGAHGVIMAEPLTGLLSPDFAAEFSHPYVKQIMDAVQDDSFAVIYHNCGGNVSKMISGIVSVGARGYHFGNDIRLADVLDDIPENCLVMGNVAPAQELCNGTPASVRAATLRVMEECCHKKNFVISSGCDIPPMTPWENIDAFFQAVAEFYTAKAVF